MIIGRYKGILFELLRARHNIYKEDEECEEAYGGLD